MKNENYNLEEREAIWEKAELVSGSGDDEIRSDYAGALMRKGSYGQIDDELGFGWEADHQRPLSKNGLNNLRNLVPLQWRNNRAKGDDYPEWKTEVSSRDGRNIFSTKHWKVSD